MTFFSYNRKLEKGVDTREFLSLYGPKPRVKRAKFESSPASNIGLEDLPIDILDMIFFESGNLELPSTSLVLARKLRRRKYREKQLLKHQMLSSTEISSVALTWPFTTKELVQELGVTGVEHNYIPTKLLQATSDRATALTVYMVGNGCSLEESEQLYKRLLDNGRLDEVNVLVEHKIPCSLDVLVRALELKYVKAHRLVKLTVFMDKNDQELALTRAREVSNRKAQKALVKKLLK